ncbi:hypothetical protein PsYK624_109210 [Phanerochaete sordida]|uniref:Uncharacterized protein n=1 Tax=Phanerochaete sordida TaxID=48140 RepID=A0A9P3LHK2_9APHY|nr:hypothetical protein PsYK624_109210 [Phanerochaete sordida]
MATRNLSFITTKAQGVSENTNIILTFVPVDKTDLYSKQLPVVWKLLKFAANQTQTVNVTYSARLGVAVAQIDTGLVQIPQTFIEMGLGQTTSFTTDSDNFVEWSEPSPKPAPGTGTIVADNESGSKQDLMLGTVSGETNFQPVLVWKAVNNGATMTASFTPKLRAYAYKNYQETAIIKGEIETGLLGEWDLATLNASPKVNTFHLYEDNNAGGKLTISIES